MFSYLLIDGYYVTSYHVAYLYPEKILFEGKLYDSFNDLPYEFFTLEMVNQIEIVRIQQKIS